MLQTDPSLQTLSTDSDQWQQKLGEIFEQLSANDRQLLSHYMLRMKLSDAYESEANMRTTIKRAFIQQREYERLHPNNPTGKRSPIVASLQIGAVNAQIHPIALLPITSQNQR